MKIRNFPFSIFEMDLTGNGNTHMDKCDYKL